jgi:hypothetical protein
MESQEVRSIYVQSDLVDLTDFAVLVQAIAEGGSISSISESTIVQQAFKGIAMRIRLLREEAGKLTCGAGEYEYAEEIVLKHLPRLARNIDQTIMKGKIESSSERKARKLKEAIESGRVRKEDYDKAFETLAGEE